MQMKSFLATALLALPLAFATLAPTAAPAEAGTSVRIFLGVPYYPYRVGPDYVYRSGYGWYRPGRVGKMSCGQAANMLWRKGYNRPIARDCRGTTYVFSAWRNGRPLQVYVNARTGAVWRG
jgi:hypothetical protein